MTRIRFFPTICVMIGLLLANSACQTAEPTVVAAPTSFPTLSPTIATKAPSITPSVTKTLRPSSTPFPSATLVPSLTPFPSRTPSPGVVGLGLTTGPFRDDFSDPLSGWPEESGSDFGFGYLDGGYNMYNNLPNSEICAARTRSHSDFIIEVKVTKRDGPNDSYFGVTCRKTGMNYFSLAINGNGEFVIYKTTGGLRELLVNGSSNAIKKGNATNSLRASCIGDIFTLEVNGQELVSHSDPGFKFGSFVGLVVGTLDQVGIDVQFDNFNSYPP